jgi:hypothetical protein
VVRGACCAVTAIAVLQTITMSRARIVILQAPDRDRRRDAHILTALAFDWLDHRSSIATLRVRLTLRPAGRKC